MLSEKERDRRYKRIREGMKKEGLSLLLICGSTMRKGHVQYVSEYSISFDGAYVVYPIQGRPTLYVFSAIQQERGKQSWVKDSRFSSDFGRDILARIKELKGARAKIGLVGTDIIPAKLYLFLKENLPRASFTEADDLFFHLRATKGPEEIAMAKRSAALADITFAHVKKVVKPGISEHELYAEIDYALKKKEVEESFNLIASGPLPVYPHLPLPRIIKTNDRVSLEITPRYNGYYTQLTINLTLGKTSRICQRLVKTCLEALEEGVQNLRPGVQASQVARAMKEVVKGAGFTMPFRGGHGLGLEVDEIPTITLNSDTVLKPDMVAVIHPCAVIPGKGGVFLGHTYLVTPQGHQRLNNTPLG